MAGGKAGAAPQGGSPSPARARDWARRGRRGVLGCSGAARTTLAAAPRRYARSLEEPLGDPTLGTHPRDRAHGAVWQASSLRSPPRPEGRLPAPTASGAQGSSSVTRPGPRPSSAPSPRRQPRVSWHPPASDPDLPPGVGWGRRGPVLLPLLGGRAGGPGRRLRGAGCGWGRGSQDGTSGRCCAGLRARSERRGGRGRDWRNPQPERRQLH